MQSEQQKRTPGHPRSVLLAGSARGGTSWALKVLDSHPAVCGCHEPFHQLSSEPALQTLFDRLKSGTAAEGDADLLLGRATQACIETHKPPFFRKDFLRTPATIRSAAWLTARAFPPAESIFQYLATGNLNENHRLVIKNRPFPHLDRILNALHSDVLALLRHPCGVVSSWLKGIQMGVMAAVSTDAPAVWNRYASLLTPLGFDENQLCRMSPAGVLAVNWLVDTILFQQYENSGLRTKTIVYCDLVTNPVEEWSSVLQWMGLSMCSSVESFLADAAHSTFDVRKLMGRKYEYFSVRRSDNAPLSAWKQHLTKDQVSEIRDIICPHFPVDQYWPGSFEHLTHRELVSV